MTTATDPPCQWPPSPLAARVAVALDAGVRALDLLDHINATIAANAKHLPAELVGWSVQWSHRAKQLRVNSEGNP